MKVTDGLILGLMTISIVSGSVGIASTNSLRKERDYFEGRVIDLEAELDLREEEIYSLGTELAKTENILSDAVVELHQTEDEILHYDYCGEFTITTYCCEKYPHICGGGNTASGVAPTPDLTCAVCDLEMFPYGTIIYIEGIGLRVVQDTGGFDFSKIDVAVAKHEEASRWKNEKHKVWIVEPKKGE